MAANARIVAAILAALLACGAPATAEAPAWQVRDSALATAEWAIAEKRAAVLADSIALLLDNGGATDPDAPWSVAPLLDALRGMEGGPERADELLARQGRGVAIGGGALRYDLLLDRNEEHRIHLTMADGEPAIIEVRLYRGSDGADIDLRVFGPDDSLIGEDVGTASGVEGHMAFVEFTPDTCIPVTVHLANSGRAPARIAILAPPAIKATCSP